MKYVQETAFWNYPRKVTLCFETQKQPAITFYVDIERNQQKIVISGTLLKIGSLIPLHTVEMQTEETTTDALAVTGRQIFSAWLRDLYQNLEEEHDQLLLYILRAKYNSDNKRREFRPEAMQSRRQADTRMGYGVQIPGYTLDIAAFYADKRDEMPDGRGYLVFQSNTSPQFWAEIKWAINVSTGSFLFWQVSLLLNRSIGSLQRSSLIIESHTVSLEDTEILEPIQRLLMEPRLTEDPATRSARHNRGEAQDPQEKEKRQVVSFMANLLAKSLETAVEENNEIFILHLIQGLWENQEHLAQMDQNEVGNLVPVRVNASNSSTPSIPLRSELRKHHRDH
ncbi:hypothetical protein KSF_107510 [Reticulibacter mediterranei]|uniref:Uncharacterized protein n=1 Tax=Reticulibacter mediterranei TaxID=2778369 RepID=A0A8J3N9E8_9CHLR|nr:hypothetical protein [Reticulibacter mediterranei]GHP00704.1 hypothetical protein KSF_107510 [Reticulibacter mediterranei]